MKSGLFMEQQPGDRFRTAHAVRQTGDAVKNASEAVHEIRDAFRSFAPSLIVFFASVDYDPDTLAREMKTSFPTATAMGCTTAGEQVDGKLLEHSLVAMAFSSDVFDYCESALVLGTGERPDGADVFGNPSDAMTYIGRNLRTRWLDLDHHQYIGFMLGDQISDFAEGVLDRLGEITNAMFVGGFAGDGWRFNGSQRVMYGGKAYSNAAILALWKPKRGFDILKTQAGDLTGKKLLITRADEVNRIIWEFDGEDATVAYARATGRDPAKLDADDFSENPVALTVDGDPYMLGILKPVDGKGLQFFARVREGTRREIVQAGDIVETTHRDLSAKLAEMGDVAAILHINCCGRHAVLAKRGEVDTFGTLFNGVPVIGMSSYGEIWVGVIAYTSTMILFK